MADILLLIIRWLHAVAAVSWVGGGIFYWAVLRPALRNPDPSNRVAMVARAEFGQLVRLAMGALLVTGVILAFSRLSDGTTTLGYYVVLSVKVGMSAWMFAVVWGRGQRRLESRRESAVRGLGRLASPNAVVVLGLVVFFLSDVLRLLVELELEG